MVVASLRSSVTALMFCFIFIFGSFLNGWIVLTFLKLRRTLLSRPQDVIMLSMAIGDFVTSFFVCPLGFSSAIAQHWLWGDIGCVLYAFTTTWVGLTSVIKLVLLAVERYIAFRNSTLNVVTVRQAFQAVLISWLLTFFVSCAPLIGLSKYTLEGIGLHCSILWDIGSIGDLTFCLFLLIVFYFVPIGVILVCYMRIFLIVGHVYKNADNMRGPEALATRESHLTKVKTAKQLLFIIVGFIITWSPYVAMSVMIVIFHIKTPLSTREYFTMFTKTVPVSNPLVYFFTYRRLQQKALKILRFAHR